MNTSLPTARKACCQQKKWMDSSLLEVFVTPAGFKPTSGAGGFLGWGLVGDGGGFQHGGLDRSVILMGGLARFWHGVIYYK